MRGKLSVLALSIPKYGITPADAGKTQVLADGGNTDEDHPRRCGENNSATRDDVADVGSPPQVRGKPRLSLA